ncbi:MAG TPA: hypothetical protein VGD78_01530 [Chthoniobacterales bacterium]
MEPSKPPNLSSWCRYLLEWLQRYPEAAEIVRGGGAALSHYCAHRPTLDCDAWWKSSPQPHTINLAREAMKALAAARGAAFKETQWGDVLSFGRSGARRSNPNLVP